MSYGTLVLIVAAGILGPIAASVHRLAPPAVVGEIAAGVIVGRTGFGWVHAGEPTLVFLASVGFAMLMFVVGTHLPVRDRAMRSAVGKGALVTLTTAVLATAAGFGLAPLTGYHRPLVFAVLLATSSAAAALPVIQDGVAPGHGTLVAIAWISIADVATVLAIPLVMSTGHLGRVVLGAMLVIGLAALAYLFGAIFSRHRLVEALRTQSHTRGWALDLRLSLAVLFLLAWVATRFGTSVLIAGFAAGTVVSLLGEPRRVAQQLIGIAEGFFVPLFFIHLGARLDLRAFAHDGRAILLAGVLMAANVLTHLVSARLWSLPIGVGLLAAAQLGVPSAIASIGLATGALTAARASAIMVAVLGSLAACSIGASTLGRGPRIGDVAAPSGATD